MNNSCKALWEKGLQRFNSCECLVNVLEYSQYGEVKTTNLRPYQSEIIEKTRQSWRLGYKRNIICLPCGGGKTVVFAYMAEQSQKNGKTVWFLVHRTELLKQTIDTFSRFNIPTDKILIGMVATVANHLSDYPAPDFIIFDECHFSMASTWKKIIDKFPNAYITGLTATPCRLDGKPLGTIYSDLILGITANELISQGYLSDYKYYAPTVSDLSSLKIRGKDYDAQSATELLNQRAVFGNVIDSYRKYADGLQTICYCSSIKHSEDMAEQFRSHGISAVHFDGNTPAKERAKIISDFRDSKIKILCNVDLISVGFDCPDCWCCILLRPTLSTALYIQQACRALRPAENKTAIILDCVNNYQRHGLPTDNREWSLESDYKPPRQTDEDGKFSVRVCEECYATFPSTDNICPVCGAEYKLTRKEIQNIQEIKLQEIKQAEENRKAAYREKCLLKVKEKDISDCKNMSEIMAWCKANGRKSGYGWIMAGKMGLTKK